MRRPCVTIRAFSARQAVGRSADDVSVALPATDKMLQQIRDTIVAELSDLKDAAGFTRVCVRLLFAGGCGGLLGYQREHHGKSAGLRTHVLVSLGAAIYAMTPQLAGASPDAMTRVVQGIVVGIGFLGAGAIVRGQARRSQRPDDLRRHPGDGGHRHDRRLGREMTAVISTLLALAVLAFVPYPRNGDRDTIGRAANPMPPTPPPDETKML